MTRDKLQEWRWVVIVSAGALLLSTVPYAVGYLASSPEMAFGGAVINIQDVNSCLSEMHQGARGEWTYQFLFTPEPHSKTFYPHFYVLLGHVARWINLTLPATFHLARFVLGFGALLAAYGFSSLFIDRQIARRIAFLLMAFSSGIGWLIVIFSRTGPEGISPIDFWFMDAYVFFSIFTFPHFSLSILGVIGVFAGILRYLDTPSKKWLVVVGFASLVTAAVHPFMAIVIDLALAIYGLFLWQRERYSLGRLALPIGLAGLLPLPLLIDMVTSTGQDPVLGSFRAQNVTPSPPPLYYLAGYAPVLLLGLPAAVRILQKGNDRHRFLLAWFAAVSLLVYAPFALQRRVVEGIYVALCILAARGLTDFWLPAVRRSRLASFLERQFHYPRRRLRTLSLSLVLGLSTISNLYLVSGLTLAAGARNPELFHAAAETEALNWLEEHSDPDDTVLAGYSVGSYVPAYIGHRVFLGHPIETADYDTKMQIATDLFDGSIPDHQVQALLDQYDVAFIYIGPDEWTGRWDVDSKPYLALRFQADDVAVYQVQLDKEQ